MNQTMYVFLVLLGMLVVCYLGKWILDMTFPPPPPMTPAPPPTTDTSPYRSSTPPTETAKAAEDVDKVDEPPKAPLPAVIVDWSPVVRENGAFATRCPACTSLWIWCGKDVAPRLCACDKCDTAHFHIDCNGTDLRGCGLDWIMRSALSKPPIITPPPAITDTTKESS